MKHFLLTALFAVALMAVFFPGPGGSALAADIKNGIKIYAEYCEDCHGPGGEGMAGMGELRPWDQLLKTDEELFGTIRDGNMAMPGFDGLLTSEEMLDVLVYMRTFQ